MSKYQSNQTTNSITCPRCGTVNLAEAMNCRQCRINLKFALENLDVAKGITPPDRESQIVQEFHPSKFRYLTWFVGALVLGTLMGLSLSYITDGSISPGWWAGVLGTTTLPILRAFFTFRNYKVIIMDDSLSGPSASGWDTVVIKLAQIDTQKMQQRNFLERLEGSRSVYSIDRKRIILSSLVYNQNQIRAMLNSIGSEIK